MIYLFDYLSQHPLSFQTGVLFLDFDGTLVPLRPTLHEAKLSPSMRHILMGLMVKAAIDMVIVSGRQLKDLKQMVGIDGINLAGNHGMEWEIKGKRDSIQLPAPIHDALGDIITALEPVAEQYKGSILENKEFSLAFHYRQLQRDVVPSFFHQVENILTPYVEKKLITVMHGKEVFDIKPHIVWDKGEFALQFLHNRQFGGKTTSIYIGDDTTDESAFQKLPFAYTIRVGQSAQSAAKYYVDSIEEVEKFLASLLV